MLLESITLWLFLLVQIHVGTCTITSSSFISTWDTLDSGSIQLPLQSTGTYDMSVDWGDDSITHIDEYDINLLLHNYSVDGQYTIIINGIINGFRFADNYLNAEKLLSVSQWGDLLLGNSGAYFKGCSNLRLNATDSLNLTGVQNADSFFCYCHQFNGIYI